MSDALNNGNDTPKDAPEKEAPKAADQATAAPKAAAPKPAAPKPSTSGAAAAAAPQKSKTGIIIGVVIAVIVIAAVIIALVVGGGNKFYDNSAQGGQAPYKTEEEVQAELNRTVEEGMLNISIASIIEFENGSSEGTAYIENVPSNKYDMSVTITLDSNGDVIYQSGALKPDQFINTIKLSQNLAAGTYPATATFTAYDTQTHEEVGQAAAKITIVVDQ